MQMINKQGSTFTPELGKTLESPLFIFWKDLSENLAGVGWAEV